MSSVTKVERPVRNVTAFCRRWCRLRRLPPDLVDDLTQEAQLAALTDGPDARTLVRAMDRLRKREYRAMPSLSSLGLDRQG